MLEINMKIALLLLSAFTLPAFASQVDVVIENVKSTDGEILVAIYDAPNGFPQDYNQAVMNVGVSASSPKTLINLDSGEYAIALFHDVNLDGKMNTNSVGIPTEPFGFSNNPRILFGPPSFRKASFKVQNGSSKKLSIRLKSIL